MTKLRRLRLLLIILTGLFAGPLGLIQASQAQNLCRSYLSEGAKVSRELHNLWVSYALVNPKDAISLKSKEQIWELYEAEIAKQSPRFKESIKQVGLKEEDFIQDVRIYLFENLEKFRSDTYNYWEQTKLERENQPNFFQKDLQIINTSIENKAKPISTYHSVRNAFLKTLEKTQENNGKNLIVSLSDPQLKSLLDPKSSPVEHKILTALEVWINSVSEMPTKYRRAEALKLYAFEGLSYKEIAREMGVSYNRARELVRAAFYNFAKKLDPESKRRIRIFLNY